MKFLQWIIKIFKAKPTPTRCPICDAARAGQPTVITARVYGCKEDFVKQIQPPK